MNRKLSCGYATHFFFLKRCFSLLFAFLYPFIALSFAALVLFLIWIAGALAQCFSSLTVVHSSSIHSLFSCFRPRWFVRAACLNVPRILKFGLQLVVRFASTAALIKAIVCVVEPHWV
jgi:hypothetical protein